jgi:hypothetical protein
MSINLEILQNKLETTKDDQVKVDLLSRSLNNFGNETFDRRFIVDNSMVMRPDLLCLDVNNSLDFTEILKTNYISNPFTLNTDDLILLRSAGTNLLVNPTDETLNTDEDIRNNYVNPDKAATPDKNIQKLTNKFKKLQELGVDTPAPSPNNLPPNFNEFGDGEVELINNKVRFAPGVGRNTSECSTEPISKAELISQVLKNKLNSLQ